MRRRRGNWMRTLLPLLGRVAAAALFDGRALLREFGACHHVRISLSIA